MGIALSGGQKTVSHVREIDMVVFLCCSVKEARPLIVRGAADLMYCYCIYNRSFVVRISRSVICPLPASSQGVVCIG